MKEEIKSFFHTQLEKWELADKNFKSLSFMSKRPFKVGDLEGYIQFNPSRSVSSQANLDEDSIRKRKCFLCANNRPSQQNSIEIIEGWELLVNPFPILPYHFTIVGKDHIPQNLNKEIGEKLALLLPGFVVFFNSEGAGASAPDHIHFQAVPFNELPLIKLLSHQKGDESQLKLPFSIILDEKDLLNNENPVNVFWWVSDDNTLNFVAIPRFKHRPDCFFRQDDTSCLISPGAIDMAGIIVATREKDFNSLTDKEIESIYKEVGIS